MVRCAVDVTLEVLTGGSMSIAIDTLERQVCGPHTVFTIIRPRDGDRTSPTSSTSTAAAACLAGDQSIESYGGGSWDIPVVMQALTDASGVADRLAAPVVEVQPVKGKIRWSTLHLDVLCFVPHGTSALHAAEEHVRSALAKQISSWRVLLGDIRPVRALHFCPPGMEYPVTVVYPLSRSPTEEDEAALRDTRHELHAVLGLPTDRPLLRLANALDPGNLSGSSSSSSSHTRGLGIRLSNVHEGLPASGIQNGTVSLVQGTYDYFHYMQDRFDDSGWGCAYRSLQTICSWFNKQHYTARLPPTHREIQTTLVSIGDKTQDFVGSRQWIGAIELGYVLDSLLGVECKVMTVLCGAEMPTRAREISHHFQTQGECTCFLCFFFGRMGL